MPPSVATFGDVVTYTCDERTTYNQEALGLPMAFHGTSVPAPTWVPLPQPLVFALQVLSPGELLSLASSPTFSVGGLGRARRWMTWLSAVMWHVHCG